MQPIRCGSGFVLVCSLKQRQSNDQGMIWDSEGT